MTVYTNMPFAEYQAIDALNPSGAKTLLLSPKQFKFERDNPSESSYSQIEFQAVHCAVLEPESFDDRYMLYSETDTRGAGAYKLQCAKYPMHQHLTKVEWKRVQAKAQSMRDDGWRELCGDCWTELTLTGVDPETGCPIKGRIDVLGRYLRDPKNIGKLIRRELVRMSHANKWHVSMAAYMLLIEQNRGELEALKPGWSATWTGEAWLDYISGDAPYEWLPRKYSQVALEDGDRLFRQAQGIYLACKDAGKWPGVKDVQADWEIDLPGYAGDESDVDDTTIRGW